MAIQRFLVPNSSSGARNAQHARGRRSPQRGADSAGRAATILPIWAVLGLIAAYAAIQYPHGFSMPFINDDYVFLDKTRYASFGSLWGFQDLAFNWYRPWSREAHYWLLQRLFGVRELPFHVVSLALWLGVMGLYFAWVRSLAGGAAAVIATAGVAALSAWAVPLLWIAGVQELWALGFGLLCLHAVARQRPGWAALVLVGALMSKETAALLPVIAVLYRWLVRKDPPSQLWKQTWPLWAVVGAWALVHPVLGGRLWRPLVVEAADPVHRPSLILAALKTILAQFNLELWPRPESGWGPALLRGAVGAAVLGLVMWLGLSRARTSTAMHQARRQPNQEMNRILLFGAAWASIGWAPLFVPSLGWHAYYGLLGTLGAWLAISTFLRTRPWLAVSLVAVVALLRPAAGDTPTLDWGSEWYQRRAGDHVHRMRDDLMRLHPTFPPHSRLYMADVPGNIGLMIGDGPAFRTWYGEPTLRVWYYSRYRARSAADSSGRDFFFRHTPTGWREIIKGPESLDPAIVSGPHWESDHLYLGMQFAKAGDWHAAFVESEKLVTAFPHQGDHAYNAGWCLEQMGDSSGAAHWYARAAALPGAAPEVLEAARRSSRFLRER